MLSVNFGQTDNAYYGSGWFKNNYEEIWLEDPFVGDMLRDIDKFLTIQ